MMFIKTFLNFNKFCGNYIVAIIICLYYIFDILPTFYFINSLLNQVSHVHLPSFRIIIPMRLSPNQIERTMTFVATLTVVPLVLKGRPFFPSYMLVHNYTMSPFIFTKGAGKKREVSYIESLSKTFGSLKMPSL